MRLSNRNANAKPTRPIQPCCLCLSPLSRTQVYVNRFLEKSETSTGSISVQRFPRRQAEHDSPGRSPRKRRKRLRHPSQTLPLRPLRSGSPCSPRSCCGNVNPGRNEKQTGKQPQGRMQIRVSAQQKARRRRGGGHTHYSWKGGCSDRERETHKIDRQLENY